MADHLGLLYYREYFNELEFKRDVKSRKMVAYLGNQEKNTNIFNQGLFNYETSLLNGEYAAFQLMTTYPGLLVGSGYKHGIGGKKIEEELSLGYYFDATSGLPVIPCSSIKGVIRNAFERGGLDYINSLLIEIDKDAILDDTITKEELLNVFFEGIQNDEYLPSYKRDIFLDAIPIISHNTNGVFLANDYITHHESPLKDPKPVQFMKVLPLVVYQFNFRLTNTILKKENKELLFKQILLDLGIGAKTNTGYGQWTDKTDAPQKSKTSLENISEAEKGNRTTDVVKDYTIIKPFGDYPKNKEIKGMIIDELEGHFVFKIGKNDQFIKKIENIIKYFEKNAEKRKKNNKSNTFKELAIGDTVIIRINNINDNNFTVLPDWI